MIESALASGNPVTLTIPVYSEFYNDNGEVVAPPGYGSVLYGYHEVLAYGYNVSGVKVRNQWGLSWGDHGNVVLSWAFADSYVLEVWAYQTSYASGPPLVRPAPTTFRERYKPSWSHGRVTSWTHRDHRPHTKLSGWGKTAYRCARKDSHGCRTYAHRPHVQRWYVP